VKVERGEGAVRVLFCTAVSDGGAAALLTWRLAHVLPEGASDAEIETAVERVLADPDNVATCEECGRRNPRGCVFDEQLCRE
jgi:hypothetical protein